MRKLADIEENHVSYRSQLRMVREIASLINSSQDLQTILRHIVYGVCHQTMWSMGGISSIDAEGGYAYSIVRHTLNPNETPRENKWNLLTSPSRVSLEKNGPVIIPDAQTAFEYPAYQQEATKRGYHTVVTMPMGCRDTAGRPMVLSVQSHDKVEVNEDDLAFLETVIHLGAIAVEKSHYLAAERSQADRLQIALKAHATLMEKVLSDGSVASSSSLIETILPNPFIVIDLTANTVIAGRSPQPEQLGDVDWQEAVRGPLARYFIERARLAAQQGEPVEKELTFDNIGPRIRAAARIDPLFVDDEAVGAVIVFSQMADYGDLDLLLLESAKFALSVQMMRSVIQFRSESRNLTDFFSEILDERWRDKTDLLNRARRLNIDLTAPVRLLVVDLPQEADQPDRLQDAHRSAARIAEQHHGSITVFTHERYIICLIPAAEDMPDKRLKALLQRLTEEIKWISGKTPAIVLSDRLTELADYPVIWRDCVQLLRLAVRFERSGVITAKDFGPFPVLLSAAGAQEVRKFVDGMIGALIRYDQKHGSQYRATLSAFLDCGCRSQACADAMGLHVTTLRYRLSRLRDLFGIEHDTPEKRFTLELALRFQDILDGRQEARKD